jgi:hypothetical protein
LHFRFAEFETGLYVSSYVFRHKGLPQFIARFELVARARELGPFHAPDEIRVHSVNMEAVSIQDRFVTNVQHDKQRPAGTFRLPIRSLVERLSYSVNL